MLVSVLTLFPEYFQGPLSTSILGRAVSQKKIQIRFINLREFGEGNYKAVDDRPFGGGEGMVMKATVVESALEHLLGSASGLSDLENSVRAYKESGQRDGVLPFCIYLSPQGGLLTAKTSRDLATRYDHLVLLCGHYEGVDERAIEAFFHQELSIGDYVLTGGEPAAVVVLDALARFIPDVVGTPESVAGDTFEKGVDGGLKHAVYTRPPEWRGRTVPDVLLSGNHGEIDRWRRENRRAKTKQKRPDLS